MPQAFDHAGDINIIASRQGDSRDERLTKGVEASLTLTWCDGLTTVSRVASQEEGVEIAAAIIRAISAIDRDADFSRITFALAGPQINAEVKPSAKQLREMEAASKKSPCGWRDT